MGLRNNNLWNIKKPGKDRWLGTIDHDGRGHAVYDDPVFSGRAFLRELRADQRNGKNTLRQICADYAPASDMQGSIPGNDQNDPLAYAKYLGKRLKVGIDEPLDLFLPDGTIRRKEFTKELMRSMGKYECGNTVEFPDEFLERCILYYYST